MQLGADGPVNLRRCWVWEDGSSASGDLSHCQQWVSGADFGANHRLAEQHARRFRERLEPEGINVEVLNRFRTKSEQGKIVERLKAGRVDVVIGTHRLLSADISPKKLGLLVVDEEHRFGVKHKERIKQLKHRVNVLAMSATPIPRTLYMSLSGIRDVSVISTPPSQRDDIRTEIARFDEELIKGAIERELQRGGQVFVLHNKVQSIDGFAETIRGLVPSARVAVAHGQMTGSKLEAIMVSFVRREVQVLVSTTIIENGIDIPSANTMIIDRADTFGLSQLHQIRGRIGRGRQKAYAFLLASPHRVGHARCGFTTQYPSSVFKLGCWL